MLRLKEDFAAMTNVENPGPNKAMGSPPNEHPCNAQESGVPDDVLVMRAAYVLIWNALVPANTIRVTADRGRITLTGAVEWDYQRNAAEAAVRPMCGVLAVTNNIAIRRHDPARK